MLRLGLKAVCLREGGSVCDEPMEYKWYVYKPNTTEPLSGANLMEKDTPLSIGCDETGCNQEIALKTQFFDKFSSQSVYHISLKATNGPPQLSTGI